MLSRGHLCERDFLRERCGSTWLELQRLDLEYLGAGVSARFHEVDPAVHQHPLRASAFVHELERDQHGITGAYASRGDADVSQGHIGSRAEAEHVECAR